MAFQVPEPTAPLPFEFDPGFSSPFGSDLFQQDQTMLPEDLSDDIPSTVPMARPVELQGQELERFLFRFRHALENSISRMRDTIWKEAEYDRKIYKMQPRRQEYKGQPNITSPTSANKADGVIAHIRDSIEQFPFYAFNAEGSGPTAEEAAQVGPVCEAYFEREINLSGSRRHLAAEAVREAVIVGTAIPKLSVAEHPSGEHFVQVGELIRLENFVVDRISVDDLRHVFCGYWDIRRWYQLDELAQDGYLDPVAVEGLRGFGSSSAERSDEEQEKGFSPGQVWEEENQTHTIWTCYMRYRAVGDKRSELYEVVYHKESMAVLALRKSPWAKAFDAPPLGTLRIGKQSGHLFGRGIVRRLAQIQRMADNAINNHLAINNLAANPPFVYDSTSAFGDYLDRNGISGLRPGMGIPAIGDLSRNGIREIMFSNPRLNLEDLAIFQQFASDATYTEEAIGSSSDRKTLGQFQIEVQRGTVRLRLDLTDLAYDYSDFGTMYWSAINAYKIGPAGIVSVSESGKLLASRTIPAEDVTSVTVPVIQRMIEAQEIPWGDPAYQMEMNQEINALLTNDTIPSARRPDLSISLTGTRIVADKMSELQMLFQLTPYITTMIDAARQDSYYNYHLRSIIEAMGFKDVNKRIPRDPGKFIQDPQQREEATAAMNGMYSSMSAV